MMTPHANYALPYVEEVDGRKQLTLPDYPVVFFALGDAPGAIGTDDANDLMVRTLEALEHPDAAHYRAQVELDPHEYLESGELRLYDLYEELEALMRAATPPTHEFLDGGFVDDEGIWCGWAPKPTPHA